MNDSTHPADNLPFQPAKPLPITRMFAKVCYGLFIAGCFLPPLLLVAVALNLLRRGHAQGTWLESHFRRQLKSFLIALAMLAPIMLAFVFLSGVPYLLSRMLGAGMLSISSVEAFALLIIAIMLLPILFFLTRMVRGLGALNRNEAV